MKKAITIIMLIITCLSITSCSIDTEQASTKVNKSKKATKQTKKQYGDLELLTLKGHPIYRDPEDYIFSKWEKINEKNDHKIVLPEESYDEVDDEKTIIWLHSEYEMDYINELFLYFSNIKTKEPVDLNKALSITKEYLPVEKIKGKYKIEKTEKLVSDYGDSVDPTYYTIDLYRKVDDDTWPLEIFIIVQQLNSKITESSIREVKETWMGADTLDINGYHSEKWTYDLFK